MLISDWSSDFCSSDLVTFDGWIASLNGGADSRRLKPVRDYANRLYQQAITDVLDGARDLEKTKVIPSRYVLAATEMIGQDQANDVSHIFLVKQRPGGEPRMTALVRNARIFHLRTEERRVGKECVSTGRYRGAP